MYKCAKCKSQQEGSGELKVLETRKVTYNIGDRVAVGSEIVKEERLCPTCAEQVITQEVGEVSRTIFVPREKKEFRRGGE